MSGNVVWRTTSEMLNDELERRAAINRSANAEAEDFDHPLAVNAPHPLAPPLAFAARSHSFGAGRGAAKGGTPCR